MCVVVVAAGKKVRAWCSTQKCGRVCKHASLPKIVFVCVLLLLLWIIHSLHVCVCVRMCAVRCVRAADNALPRDFNGFHTSECPNDSFPFGARTVRTIFRSFSVHYLFSATIGGPTAFVDFTNLDFATDVHSDDKSESGFFGNATRLLSFFFAETSARHLASEYRISVSIM